MRMFSSPSTGVHSSTLKPMMIHRPVTSTDHLIFKLSVPESFSDIRGFLLERSEGQHEGSGDHRMLFWIRQRKMPISNFLSLSTSSLRRAFNDCLLQGRLNLATTGDEPWCALNPTTSCHEVMAVCWPRSIPQYCKASAT
jgi:hypothetical protein